MRPISAWLGCNNSEVFPVLCRTRAMRFPLRMFLVCPDVRRLSGSSRFPHYWQGPLGNVWQVYLYRNAKCRRIWIKTVLTLRRTIRLSICNPVYKPGTLKNKIGKINTITYDNRIRQATLFYKMRKFLEFEANLHWIQ